MIKLVGIMLVASLAVGLAALALRSRRWFAGRLLVEPTPDEAARAIYDYLVEEGILSAPAGETVEGEAS